MYIVANRGLGMSPGKLAAQVAHAAVKAFEWSLEPVRFDKSGASIDIVKLWNETGHTKIVLEARDTEHLLMVERYLAEHGFAGVLIIDEGRTEIDPHTPTALGIPIVDKDDEKVQFAFGDLRTYRENKPEPPLPRTGKTEGKSRKGWPPPWL